MDDTPGRVKPGADDLSGRANEQLGTPAGERARNYATNAGNIAEPVPDIVTPGSTADAATAGTYTSATTGAVVSTSPAAPASTVAASTSGSELDEDADLSQRTSQIRGEIEQTREEMTETIDAIQEKLRPSNIVANATDRVKQATSERMRSMADMASGTANDMMEYGRDAYGTVAGEVRQNPLPLAMIGIGAAWLLMGRSSSSSSSPRGRSGYQRNSGWNSRSAYAGGPYDQGNNFGQAYDRAYYNPATQTEGLWRQADRNREQNGGFMSVVSNNPIPAAMAAMGIAWLAFSHREDLQSEWNEWQRGDVDDRWRQQYREAQRRGVGYTGTNTGSGGSSYEGSYQESGSGIAGSVRESAQNVASTAQDYATRAKDYASDVTSRAREYAGDASERASEYVDRAQEYAGEAMGTVQRRGRQAQNELQRMMNDNPLLVGAGALALGAVIGMALPETERENEWMGEARNQVFDRAQHMARDAASRVQDAAGDMVGEVASRVVTGDKPS